LSSLRRFQRLYPQRDKRFTKSGIFATQPYYLLAKGLGATVVAIAQLPAVPETLWLRLLGKGDTQERAIAELLELPERDPKRESALNLLVSWRINMEIVEEFQREERDIQMALSQAYLEWENQTERRGL
jgi:hypothetical protein